MLKQTLIVIAVYALCVLACAGCQSNPEPAGERETLDAAKAHAAEAAGQRGNLQNITDEADSIIRKLKQ